MANIMYKPTIEVESANGTREVSLETRHFMNRRLFLNGTIDSDMANDFLLKFMYLEQESKDPVTIYINSTGGEVVSGLMIYDIIKNS
nr:ATP-dependent Clp protease proteolytic subunit [Lachnospiraceae bacterium]